MTEGKKKITELVDELVAVTLEFVAVREEIEQLYARKKELEKEMQHIKNQIRDVCSMTGETVMGGEA